MPDTPKTPSPATTAPTRPSPPFLSFLGGQVIETVDGPEVRLELKPDLCNTRGHAHGGVVMTLLDVAMARAARARRLMDGLEDHGAMTIEMKTSFMSPGVGHTLVARGVCLQRTATMAFCEAEILDAAGHRVARASGTFKFVNPRGARPRTDG